MPEAVEHVLQGNAGELLVRAWQPAPPPRAVVAICHGFNAHGGMYAWCGDRFVQAGMAACALDLRGRGRSAGERFHVGRFEDYADDLAKLVDFASSLALGAPVYLLGHSAGGVTACLLVLRRQHALAGLICEDFAFDLPAPRFALALIKGIGHVAPRARALALKNKDFSRDPTVVRAMDEDPLIAGEAQPFATMAALIRADEELRKRIPEIQLPLYVIHGSADKAARPSGSRYLHAHAGSADKAFKLYEGRYHDPLNDLGKEEVMSDIVAWITARLPAGGIA